MPRRLVTLANEHFYHVFNRGVEKRSIFLSARDYMRFLETSKHYLDHLSRLSRRSKFGNREANKPLVEVIAYCLMPNHFHFLLKQIQEKGISTFIGKLANSYTKYFNVKYDRIGPLLQGQFKAVLVEDDDQLIHLSRYIHLNPAVSELVKELDTYQWSSYSAYVGKGGDGLVSPEEVLSHFTTPKDYEKFVLDQVDYGLTLEKIKHSILD